MASMASRVDVLVIRSWEFGMGIGMGMGMGTGARWKLGVIAPAVDGMQMSTNGCYRSMTNPVAALLRGRETAGPVQGALMCGGMACRDEYPSQVSRSVHSPLHHPDTSRNQGECSD